MPTASLVVSYLPRHDEMIIATKLYTKHQMDMFICQWLINVEVMLIRFAEKSEAAMDNSDVVQTSCLCKWG